MQYVCRRTHLGLTRKRRLMTQTPNPPAGWYPNPDGSGNQRYWDGVTWTDASVPPAPRAPAAPLQPVVEKQKNNTAKGCGCLVLLVAAIVVVIVAIVSAVSGGGSDSSGLKSSKASGSASSLKSDSSKSDANATVGTQKNPAPRGTAVQNKSDRYQIDKVQVKDSLGAVADKPAGRYVVVTITVTNVKNKSVQISSDDFKLDVAGTEIDTSDQGVFLDGAFSYDQLSPGLSRTGKIVFDVARAEAGKGVLKMQALLSTDEAVYLKLQ